MIGPWLPVSPTADGTPTGGRECILRDSSSQIDRIRCYTCPPCFLSGKRMQEHG